MKTISYFETDRTSAPTNGVGSRDHAAPDLMLSRTLTLTGQIPVDRDADMTVREALRGDWFDMQTDSHYSTRACWSAVCENRVQENRITGKPFNGSLIHTRGLSVLLFRQPSAGVFPGLDSEDQSIGTSPDRRAMKRCGFFVLSDVCIEFS